MMKKISLIFVFILLSQSAFPCELPPGEKLTIGCAYDCGFSYKLRLKLAALVKGYSIKFKNMRNYSSPEEGMEQVDAILIPGGADIDPEFYLDSVTPELADYTRENLDLVLYSSEGIYRDAYEYELVQKYSSDNTYQNLPLLGICRGMQMMSVAQGIPLYLDIFTETGIKNRYRKFDRIDVEKESSLMRWLFEDKKFRGFKLHHQGIRMDYFREHEHEYPLVKVTATSHDKIIAEAIEYQHRPALGVQYHPEKSLPRAAYPIYDWFLTKACEYSQSKDHK